VDLEPKKYSPVGDNRKSGWDVLQIRVQEDSAVGEFGNAQVYARLGEEEKALKELERNYEERFPLATLVNVDPASDSLRSDPRFKELVRRMGMTPNSNVQ